jgi:serine/threonine protein kinase
MGAVYRARDTKLGREVAIKVPPEAVEQDPERSRQQAAAADERRMR